MAMLLCACVAMGLYGHAVLWLCGQLMTLINGINQLINVAGIDRQINGMSRLLNGTDRLIKGIDRR